MNKIAIDIGGTKIVGALFENGKLVRKFKHCTAKNKEALLLQILDVLYSCMDGIKKVEGVYVSCAGPVKNGKLMSPPNLVLHHFDLKKFIQSRVKCKVVVGHDADCFALYLMHKKKKKDFMLFALGTGVGSSIVMGKKIFKGQGAACEIGHSVIDFNGVRCGCGRKGCLEMYSSGKAIAHKYRESAHMVYDKAEQGDKKSQEILSLFGKYLGIGVADAINIFAPKEVIIAGGVASAGRYFKKQVINESRKAFFPCPVNFYDHKDCALEGALYL
jgi:glucokinase